MNNKTKWIIYSALVLIVLLIVIIFSKNMWNWFENVLVDVLIYAIVFGAGWLLGHFGGRSRSREEENARNITEAQR